jgi:hypothetical protein
MSRVRVYSGPYGRLRGLGDDPSTSDVFSTGYNPMYPPADPVAIGVPYANAPAYSGPYPDLTPPPSSGWQTAFGTEEYGTIQPGAAPGSGGSYTGVQNPSPSAGIPGIVAAGIQTIASATGASRPSPTVAVPLSSSSLGLWFSGTTLGLPTWMLLGGVVVGAALLLGSGGGGRRR